MHSMRHSLKSPAYLFGEKIAAELSGKLEAAVDPLGVGGGGPKNVYTAGAAQLIRSPRPFSEVYRDNLTVPPEGDALTHPPRPKQLDIRPHKPIRVFNPNKQQRT